MNPLNDTVNELLQTVPEDILTTAEKTEIIRVTQLIPIATADIEKLRDDQVELMHTFSNLHYNLKRKRAHYQMGLAPARKRAEDEEFASSKHKPTEARLKLVAECDEETRSWMTYTTILDDLLAFVENIFKTLDHRQRMVSEKSVDARHLNKSSY